MRKRTGEKRMGTEPTPTKALITWRGMLTAVPVRNRSTEVDESSGSVRVTMKRQRPRYLVPPLTLFIRFRPSKTVALDRLGSEIYGWCDDHRDVEQIVELFAKSHALSFHEARASVTEYLRSLVQHGVIVMAKESADSK